MRPLEEFLSTETLGGILLLVAAVAALIWANAPGDSYHDFWASRMVIDLDVVSLDLDLAEWVNDALMAVFFFVVGLEIKRELLRGELADPRRAAFPVAAALGGMIAPACAFLALNAGTDGARGWGVPMATDIAFAVGVMALLGNRVPVSLKVFLLALAIADDLGAIAVIAVFYTDDLKLEWLGFAVALLGLTYVMGRAGIRDVIVYVGIAIVAWVAVHESGVHATIAGVAFGLMTPIKPIFSREHLSSSALDLVVQAREAEGRGGPGDDDRNAALRDLEELARESQPILDRLEHALHPWTSYVIIPIFALANAGVDLGGDAISAAATSRVTAGVAVGLMLGKPLGILAFSWLAVRTGIAALPASATWSHILGVGFIAGIGFTVSIFVSNLAYTDAAFVQEAKLGILGGSLLAGVIGLAALGFITRPSQAAEGGGARVT
ncbi:MAG: Na+/H+ antiporter NhaA [Chloroflexi bacterium]|nr:Na+/H+ antiporter NhaA [Chloroflexota bacterium]